MHVFVTGATGWVGGAIVKDLIAAGHRVSGLSRSENSVASLAARGAAVIRGSLDDLDTLHAAASVADAVVHTAFHHDWTRFAESAEQDRRAIEALGDALAGSERPLLVTSGLSGLVVLGRLATERDRPDPAAPRKSELAAHAVAGRGVRIATIRLAPMVHGLGETHGFLPILIRLAKRTGVSAYLGDGTNLWAGVHRLDAARLYRQVLESDVSLPVYHAVAEEGVPFRRIAALIGARLGIPVQRRDAGHFGGFAPMTGADMAASSFETCARTGWSPMGPTLRDDLEQPDYFAG